MSVQGEATRRHYQEHPEARQRMSEVLKEYHRNHPEAGRHLSELMTGRPGHTGRPRTASEKAKLSIAMSGQGNPMYGVRLFGSANGFYGKCHSEETKEKIRQARKRQINPRLGTHHNEEAREKMRHAKVGKYIGSSNPRWSGGLSFKPYTPEFNPLLKRRIRARDNYVCQLCGISENGRKHPVHHIDYNKANCSSRNLVTLCRRCNSIVNSNRVFWEAHFALLMKMQDRGRKGRRGVAVFE